ncbi:unnamed protein product [Camellia sinensis]
MTCLKHKIDLLDVENYEYKYTLIEGDALSGKLESLSYEVKFETIDGGSKVTSTSYYHAKGDIELTEEEMAGGKDKAMGMFEVVEEYLMGCTTQVWLEVMRFRADSDSEITKGFCSCLI